MVRGLARGVATQRRNKTKIAYARGYNAFAGIPLNNVESVKGPFLRSGHILFTVDIIQFIFFVLYYAVEQSSTVPCHSVTDTCSVSQPRTSTEGNPVA